MDMEQNIPDASLLWQSWYLACTGFAIESNICYLMCFGIYISRVVVPHSSLTDLSQTKIAFTSLRDLTT